VVQLNSGAVYRGDIINRTSFPDGFVQIATTIGTTVYLHVSEIAAVA
jgi:hypothetical protein